MAADDRLDELIGRVDDVLIALREVPQRIDRVFENRDRALRAFLEPLAAEMRANAAECTARARAAEEAARDARGESRAVVEGLMRVIDRMDRLDPGAGPASA